MTEYDVVTFGESMIRFSTTPGIRLEMSNSLDLGIGGAESNVAVALARLGRRTAWSSVLPKNAFGDRIAGELRHHGVDTSNIHWVDRGRVGVYYLDVGAAPRPTKVIYDRAGSAVATCDPDDLDLSFVTRSRLLHFTGITPALGPNCAEVARRLSADAMSAGVPISFDINYRSLLWTPEQAAEVLEPFCTASTILFCGRSDARTVWGLSGSDDEILHGLASRFGAATTVLTLGEDGAIAMTQDGQVFREKTVQTSVVDRVGAGDAFASGFIHGYLDGDVAVAMKLGSTLASLKMTVTGDLAIINGQELAEWSGLSNQSIIR